MSPDLSRHKREGRVFVLGGLSYELDTVGKKGVDGGLFKGTWNEWVRTGVVGERETVSCGL